MKNIFYSSLATIVLLLCSTGIKAQHIHDFQYIAVPEKFSDFGENQYNLNNYLTLKLKHKGYTVLPSDRDLWPDELKNDPCQVLSADVKNIKHILKVKIEMIFYDCHFNRFAVINSESSIKDFERGYSAALRNAVEQIFPSAPKQVQIQSDMVKSAKTEIKPTEEILKAIPESAEGMAYSDGQAKFLLVKDKDSENLILFSSDQKAIATLIPTSRKGIYQVTVIEETGSYETIGFYDEETIEIDYKTASGETITKKFNKL